MNAIKLLNLGGSLILLSACVPHSQVNDSIQNTYQPTQSRSQVYTKEQITEPKVKSKTSLQDNKKTKESVELVSSKEKGTKTFKGAGSKITSFEISGALAARSKNKGWSAQLNWVQRGASAYQIRLSGPLGSGTILISKSGNIVTLKDGPKTASSNNAGALLKQQTGISLPVNSLYYWVRGIPSPGSIQSEKHDAAGRILMLRQNGFIVEYLQYTAYGNQILPSHIRLQGNGVFIKLIVKRWRI
ncbi:MAG: lipoprotein insertase outer membrane protein LolB [Proteobacteria bacterium]|nr:lipoprotein insertase outer membrane protein LolB [Pseudomonadota bacterium]